MRAVLLASAALLAVAAVGSAVSAAASNKALNKALVIDIGNEWAKVVVMNPHAKSALSRLEMVVNEQSNRKTPSIVGITGAGDDAERVLGEDAAGLLYRAPSDAYPQLKRLLGQKADSAVVKAYLADLPPNTHAVTAADGRGTVRFARGGGASTSVEELFVSLLQYCKRAAEQHVLVSNGEHTAITDAVLIVPEFWTPAQRTLYSQLATIAGLTVRGQLNDLTAVALDYGNRNLDALAVGAARKVVIFNVGAEGAAATLFELTKTDAGFGVKSLASAFDADIGGLDFDVAVREHLIAEFDEKNKKRGIASVRTNKKAMAKLLREARDLKEQLSAGGVATVQVEELFEGVDFAVTLTREKFDDLTRALVTRAVGPIRELFASHAAAMADVQVLELYGGGTRIPAIQHAIATEWKQFGALGKHVDGDEASAFGAGLYAANLNGVPGTKKVTVEDAHVNGAGSSAGSAQEMSDADITALRDTLARFDAAAARRAVTQEARNKLESYVVEVREKLDGPLSGKVSDADEAAVRELMSKAQDFIDYEVTKDTTAQHYADRLQALKEGVAPLLKAATAKAEKELEKQKARDAADEKARERAAKAKASERARDKKYARAQAAKEQQKTQAKAAKAAAKDKAKANAAKGKDAGAKGKAKSKGRDKGDL